MGRISWVSGILLASVCWNFPLAAQTSDGTAAKQRQVIAQETGAKPPAKPAKSKGGSGIIPGGNSKDPTNITAEKLDYFDKESKLIYSGNVVAIQGESTLKAQQLIIYLERQDQPAGTNGAPSPQPANANAQGSGDSPPASGQQVKHMDASGGVTVIQKDQVGTGETGTYDKPSNTVTLHNHVVLTQGPNVTTGCNLEYNLDSGQAKVTPCDGQPVHSLMVPGSQNDTANGAGAKGGSGAKPAAGAAKPPVIKPKPAVAN
ncbi:organic solvent tolerance protein OstA [Methylovirgula sp. 4M-Z18]|nr:organic solvent tolerance protein OstA [Methylovirgula sp. 4M-Z18]